ncbi:MAG: PepSY domain-containing protein [Candidatus Aenigmarchaeota archaeon]|nr:PepSY domain-containing protein [Candidatus Aenigmarchaeota archaeon]
MRVLDAIMTAEEKMHGKKDFFLCSCFASLKDFLPAAEWTVIFYNTKSRSVIECTCDGKSTEISVESPALQESERLDRALIMKDDAYAINKAKEDFEGRLVNLLVSLHTKGGRTVWTLSAVTHELSVTIYDIDAVTGEILRKETSGLVRRA